MKYTDPNKRPVAASPLFENLPHELRDLKQWVLWKYIWKDEKKQWDKIPMQPDGKWAKSNDSTTWSTYAEVKTVWESAKNRFDGIGIMFWPQSGIMGVDVDGCLVENENGYVINEVGNKVLSLCDSYTEISPSGTGFHILGYGEIAEAMKHSATGIEMYSQGRYFTFTGRILNDYIPVRDISAGVKSLFDSLRPETKEKPKTENRVVSVTLDVSDRLKKAFAAQNGGRIQSLFNGDMNGYGSPSEADLALCSLLAFWSDGRPDILDAMFRQSKLNREKWDEKRPDGTYGTMTLERALAGQTEFYSASRVEKIKCEPDAELPIPAAISRRRAHTFTFKELVPSMLEWRQNPDLHGVTTGWPIFDEYMQVVKKYLAIITGIPNHGKSSWIDALLTNMYIAVGWKFGIMSFETQPIQLHVAGLMSLFSGKSYSVRKQDHFTDQQALHIAEQVNDGFIFHQPPIEDMSLDKLLPYVEDTIREFGIDGLLFDPWSELTPPARLIGNMTNFVQGELSKFQAFIRRNDLAGFLVAHPAKEPKNSNGGKPKPPTLRDILDSAHFHNKADYGITVHRPNYGSGDSSDYTEVIVNKLRRGLPGKLGKVIFEYSPATGGYSPINVRDSIHDRQEDNW